CSGTPGGAGPASSVARRTMPSPPSASGLRAAQHARHIPLPESRKRRGGTWL
ncbi:MAG: hypothetical protein AVDCRST_MAG08-2468, partial [uncultured Acetobacteraceae bacterium]